MLRIPVLFLLLLLINGLYFAWTERVIPGWGPEQQTEPLRLQRQIKPQALRLLTGQEALQWEKTAASGKSPS